MRRLLLVGLLAFAVALTGTAYAEVQSVKVSGDIDMKAINHHNYDLKKKQNNGHLGTDSATVSDDDDASFYLSTVHVQVDADLTDKVSTSVRLLNQRKWGQDASATTGDVVLDNAYVVLKEFLYSPLTVKIGRQDLNYGTGFIVGPGRLADPHGVFTDANVTPAASQNGQEYSAFNSYDAVRLILDYSPLTIEGLVAKVAETNSSDNDTDLYGVIVNYKLDRWNAEVEPYWFYKRDQGAAVATQDADFGATNRTYPTNNVHTIGMRVAGSPVENLKISAEGAGQIGQMIDNTPFQKRDREGFAANVYANYTWAKVKWSPVTGAGYVYYSGEESEDANDTANDATDNFDAWDPMFRGQFHTFIQDFLTGFDTAAGLYTTFDANDTSAATNRHLFYGDLALTPMQDVTLWARYTHVRFAEPPANGRSHYAGDELDLKAIYNYTEDVQLGVFGGAFLPGKYYDEANSNARGNDLAWTLGGGAAVKF